MLRLIVDLCQLGNRGLHPEGHLLLSDRRSDLGVADLALVLAIQTSDGVEHATSDVSVDAIRIGEEEHRIAGGLKGRSLVP